MSTFSLISGFLRGIKPDPVLTVSQWADTYRMLPPTSAEPGKFRMSRTPYNREISDRLSVTDPAQIVWFKKSSQIGATETGNNWLGYTIDAVPAPFLYVMPTDTMMKDTSRNRIQKMIEATPRITHKIKPSKAKDSSNTIQYKEFEGGFFKGVGANSPVGLASTAARFVYLDEVDRYPMDVAGEGSAIKLAQTRTVTFGPRKKIFITSTPTRKGLSAIDQGFEKTGQRHFYVPCPHCGGAQVLEFTQLRWTPGNYTDVNYQCVHCGQLIPERFKTQMLNGGQWIATHPEREDGITYGYHINALYSPYGMYSWAEMVKEYEESESNIPDRITFINTKLGECYEEEGELPQWQNLYALREKFSQCTVFHEVGFITAGVDIQADRIEMEIVGWMKGKRSQSIDYRVINGSTTDPSTWEKLAQILNETFPKADGTRLPISMMAIDTGYNTQHVYEFCSLHMHTGRVIPVKGKSELAMLYSAPKTLQVTRAGQKLNTIKVFHVGVSLIKSELYGWLKLLPKEDKTYAPGYCHFPEYDEAYFRGLTAERLQRTTDKKGFVKYEWVKVYKRNEALDCRVYARAAAAIFGLDYLQDEHWQQLLQNAPSIEMKKEQKTKKKRDSIW
ncbi:MAG: phage terminase large subunit family protein [Bacteroidia bacterium]